VEKERLSKTAGSKKELYAVDVEVESSEGSTTVTQGKTVSGLTTIEEQSHEGDNSEELAAIADRDRTKVDTSLQPCYALISEKGCNAGPACKRSHKKSVILTALRQQLQYAETNVKFDPE